VIIIDSVEPIGTVGELIEVLKTKHLKQKPELFVENGQLKPGILCLINDVDWEIEDRELTVLTDADRISFISTLHGG
jgi:ubiquitin related modifier 1